MTELPLLPEHVAVMGACCNIVRIGSWEPGTVHDGLCKSRHGGTLGRTDLLFTADQMLAFRAEGIAIAVAAEREEIEKLAWEFGGNRCDVLVDAIRARSKE
jgi:hypothetical protein